MRIIIPTYRRTNEQVTFKNLPSEWKKKTTFVCDGIDEPQLSFKFKATEAEILVIPDTVKTIAQKRAWLIKTLPYAKILMLDDDLSFANRIKDSTKLLPATPEQIDTAFTEVSDMLGTYAHVGISARQGNNRLKDKWVSNTRMMYALGYFLPTVREICELGRIETREDMDYTLQMLCAGYENRVLSTLCTDQKYNAPGGASLERSIESSNADAEKLANLHSGFVKVVEKEYKSSLPRKEVICYWKKAYESGI